MRLDTRTRELSLSRLDLSNPESDLIYVAGWLTSDLYREAIRCVIVLAHHSGFVIFDPRDFDITDLVAEEVHADVVTQKFVYGTEDPV